jgi:predicted RNase H-like HicB family nuclease
VEPYTYQAVWSEEEQAYLGSCTEFPRLSHFDKSHEEALAGIRALVENVVADMKEKGETPPAASSEGA